MTAQPLTPAQKLVLVLRAWMWLVVVALGVRLQPLPRLVARLDRPPAGPSGQIQARRLGRIVFRVLRIGPRRARCLLLSLVLFRLLREQGTAAEVVIGLPQSPQNKNAHAWVEVGGFDVGPPPGRGDNIELVRYGGAGSARVVHHRFRKAWQRARSTAAR